VEGAAELRAFLADERLNAVVLGPGGGVGARMQELVGVALGRERAVVLDADALTSFADGPGALITLLAPRATAATVLTPHLGEFTRLFRKLPQIIEIESKLDMVLAAARHAGAVVLLKGADTIVAAPDGRTAIAENAPPWLATAGAGDVLAGMIVGLLAQEMPAFDAAAAAVYLHGETANEFGPGLIAEDLSEVLPNVYRRLFTGLKRQGLGSREPAG
jgi:ADP-dependent NAD(P)H-hydrate dehydratase / NAD(P)H-hydrate epimerase